MNVLSRTPSSNFTGSEFPTTGCVCALEKSDRGVINAESILTATFRHFAALAGPWRRIA